MKKTRQYSVRIRQNGQTVASVSGPDENTVVAEAARYIAQYKGEGEIRIYSKNVDLRKVMALHNV